MWNRACRLIRQVSLIGILALPGIGAAASQNLPPGLCNQLAAAARGNPSTTDLIKLADCALQMGHSAQAIERFQQAVRRAPGNKRAHIGLARALAAGGRNQEAIETLKQWLASHPGDEDALYWTGHLYQQFANQTLHEVAAEHPGSYQVYEAEGNQYRAKQQYPRALAAYQKALALAPMGTPGLHFRLGDVYWRTLRFDAAQKEFEQELALNPNHSKANYELGDIEAKLGHPKEAITHLQKALVLDPGLVEAHRSLGRAYLEGKEYPRALGEFLQVANAEPQDHTIHAQLAAVYRDMGRLAKAKQEAQLSQQLENQTIQTIGSNKASEQKMAPH